MPHLQSTAGTTLVEWVPLINAESGDWEIGGVANMNGDGRPDIVWLNRVTRQTGAWIMDRTTYLRWQSISSVESSDWQIGGIADVRMDQQYADRRPDIIWYNRAALKTGAWKMDGLAYAGWGPMNAPPSAEWELGGAADMTGDGNSDLVWLNRTTRQVVVWEMNGTAYTRTVTVGTTDSGDWEIGAVADMTGDARPDIIWQNRVTRQTGVWVMDRTTATGWIEMPPAASSDWLIGGAADLTGDGSTDIVWQNRATRQTGVWVMGSPAGPPAPPEAPHKVSYTSFRRPPYGFLAATPWLNVVHTGQQGVSSSVEIDHIQLWAEINDVSQRVATNEFSNDTFSGQLLDRSPWYGGTVDKIPGTISGGILTIRPGDRPEKVWHPYLETYPHDRANISAATRVWFVVRLRLSGPVAVQAGIDYYEQLGYPKDHRLEEGAATDWVYTQNEWITLTMERSTEVAGPITLSAARTDGTYPTGSPITASFVLHNADDDDVRLHEVGIETRRKAPDDEYCDWKKSPDAVGAFAWRQNVDLAPGANFSHSAQWSPATTGDYCIRVVEKRAGVPSYQQPYASSGFQLIRVR